jgi:hypothetical protein
MHVCRPENSSRPAIIHDEPGRYRDAARMERPARVNIRFAASLCSPAAQAGSARNRKNALDDVG